LEDKLDHVVDVVAAAEEEGTAKVAVAVAVELGPLDVAAGW